MTDTFDLLLKLWPIILACVGIIVWLVRLEGTTKQLAHIDHEQDRRIKTNEQALGKQLEMHVDIREMKVRIEYMIGTIDELKKNLN